jgi:hypothetical protein
MCVYDPVCNDELYASLMASAEPRYWWADRLAPTIVVQHYGKHVVLGDADAPFVLTPEEAEDIARHLNTCAQAVRASTDKERS